eukprot:scaffold105082_cov30-Tisochrysis_lutea.AAC.1
MQSLRNTSVGLSPLRRSNWRSWPAEVAAVSTSAECIVTESTKARPASKALTHSARATSHRRTVWSKEPESRYVESADQHTSDTLWAWSRRQATSSPRLQQRTVWSNEPDASSRPLGEKRSVSSCSAKGRPSGSAAARLRWWSGRPFGELTERPSCAPAPLAAPSSAAPPSAPSGGIGAPLAPVGERVAASAAESRVDSS